MISNELFRMGAFGSAGAAAAGFPDNETIKKCESIIHRHLQQFGRNLIMGLERLEKDDNPG